MERFKYISKERINKLPETVGVYAFSAKGGPAAGGKDKKEILYIGKAVNIKERVKNHFQQPNYRDNLFLEKVKKIGHIKTESEIEALLLEAGLIKKLQPKFNVMWRDDKNYFWVAITKEKCPVVNITHQIELKMQSSKRKTTTQSPKHSFVGPFVDGTALKKTLRLLRKIFPYYSQKNHPEKLCLWCHLKLCPGPRLFEARLDSPKGEAASPNLKQYRKDIKNLFAVLKGKKQSVLKNLKREMKIASKERSFEKAARLRDQIFSLEKVIAHARIIEPSHILEDNWQKTQQILQRLLKINRNISRIEGYDISNIQGQQATGSMVVFTNGVPDKNLYRKFRIKIEGKPDDIAMIKEVLKRRLSHFEWPYPDIILADGGKGQLNAAIKVKTQSAKRKTTAQNSKLKNIKILAIAKRHNALYIENKKKLIRLKDISREVFNLILQIRDEAHRFAISYHHKLREVDLK